MEKQMLKFGDKLKIMFVHVSSVYKLAFKQMIIVWMCLIISINVFPEYLSNELSLISVFTLLMILGTTKMEKHFC